MNFVGVQTTSRLNKKKKALDVERRECLKKKDDAGYSASVKKLLELKEKTQMALVKEVCDAIGIAEAEFMGSL